MSTLNIKKAIEDHGLSIKDVAAKMGITPGVMYTHINGNPSVEILNRIAAAIGIDVVELFDKEDVNSPVVEAEPANVCPWCHNPIKVKLDK